MKVGSELGFGEVTKRESLAVCVHPTETQQGQSQEIVQDQKGGGKIQRTNQPACNMRVTGPDGQLGHRKSQ